MMKSNRIKCCLLICSLLFSFLMAGKVKDPSSLTIKNKETASCRWNHYKALEPKTNDNGCKEYYVCCLHHDFSFSKPKKGDISSELTPTYLFANSLSDDDERLVPSYQKQVDVLQTEIERLYSKDEVTFEDYLSLRKCRSLYQGLSEDYQSLVSNYDCLSYMETVFQSKYAEIARGKNLNFSNREYSSTFDTSSYQHEWGVEVLALSNIRGVSTFWIYPNIDFSLTNYSFLHFFFKSSFDMTLEYRHQTNYSKMQSYAVKKDEWTAIDIDVREISTLSEVGFAYWVNDGSSFEMDGSFEFMPLHGEKKDAYQEAVLFDAREDACTNNDYACSFEMNHVIDNTKGNVLHLSNIVTEKEWIWFKPTVSIGVSSYKFIYFYFKTDVSSRIELKETYTGAGKKLLAFDAKANEWQKVLLPVNASSFPSMKLKDLGIAKYDEKGHSLSTIGSWYISSIYGVTDALETGYEKVDGYSVPLFQKENDFTISAYAMANIRENNADSLLKDAREAGFNRIISLYDGRDASTEEAFIEALKDYAADLIKKESKKKKLLESIDAFSNAIRSNNVLGISKANQYGLQYVALVSLVYDFDALCSTHKITVSDSLYSEIMDRFLSNIDYSDGAGFDGIFLKDEPDVKNDFSRYRSFTNSYLNSYKLKGLPFMNLLPLGDNGNTKNYKTYLDNYFSKMYPLLNYVSFDQYPMKVGGTTINNHLYNLSLFSSRIKEAGTNGRLKTFIHSTLSDDVTHDIAGIASSYDLKYQMYANMAFGSKDIAYFVYSSNTNHDDGLVNFSTFEKTKLYRYAKEANQEILSFQDAFSYFDFEGVYPYGECSQFDLIENTLPGIDDFSLSSKENNLLVSKFKKGEQNAYLLFNYVNPQSGGANTIRLNFGGQYNFVLAYLNGEKKLMKNRGDLTFNLAKGSAAFVIPLTL